MSDMNHKVSQSCGGDGVEVHPRFVEVIDLSEYPTDRIDRCAEKPMWRKVGTDRRSPHSEVDAVPVSDRRTKLSLARSQDFVGGGLNWGSSSES